MNGAVMTLARWYARQEIKKQLYAQAIKVAHVEACEITRAANKYIDDHPEIISLATARYEDLVKRGYLKLPRNRRKPSQ
jgi:methionyl-tRNA synthetase